MITANKIPNCKRCGERETCQRPCEAMESYLRRKVTRYLREIPVGLVQYSNVEWPTPSNMRQKERYEHSYAHNRHIAILTLVKLGFPRKFVAQTFGITRLKLRTLLYYARKKFNIP